MIQYAVSGHFATASELAAVIDDAKPLERSILRRSSN
jgi:hypothetical protein